MALAVSVVAPSSWNHVCELYDWCSLGKKDPQSGGGKIPGISEEKRSSYATCVQISPNGDFWAMQGLLVF